MKRDLLKELISWKDHPLRKPLILRGARQVGKSWLVEEFSKQFESFVKINFEKDRTATKLFAGNLDISKLLVNLSLHTQQNIIPGKTLLFFDEIQECENAITALRYFKEDLPELHVIAAGSLLEFILQKAGMPVGRVQFAYVHPLSFGEFLTALGRDDLREHIFTRDINPVIHDSILELLKNYMWMGGMPAVIDAWLNHKNVDICQQLQSEIIAVYMQDFYKYARHQQIQNVAKVFESIPIQLGKKFKFSNVDNEVRAASLREALLLLEKAGIVHLCHHTSGQQQLLATERDEKKFKVYLFDIGLAQRMLGLVVNKWMMSAFDLKVLDAIAEQLVAQEFIAYANTINENKLYYWHREAKNSNAEVDFLFVKNNEVIPVEVKSGRKGSMRSVHSFLDTHPNSSHGLKISEGLFHSHNTLKEIPLYAIESWLQLTNKS